MRRVAEYQNLVLVAAGVSCIRTCRFVDVHIYIEVLLCSTHAKKKQPRAALRLHPISNQTKVIVVAAGDHNTVAVSEEPLCEVMLCTAG